MEIIISPTPEAASQRAARVIARLIREKPEAVLGLATGSATPERNPARALSPSLKRGADAGRRVPPG
jgi:hypothetical protein